MARHFGAERVFRDIDTINPGALFAEVIAERIRACDALAALIGPDWLNAKDSTGRRRLHLPNDYVKQEIAAALQQNKLVIPVLIDGAPMPSVVSLPNQIASLAERHALLLTDARFAFDADQLIAALESAVVPLATTATPTSVQPQPPPVTASAGGIAVGGCSSKAIFVGRLWRKPSPSCAAPSTSLKRRSAPHTRTTKKCLKATSSLLAEMNRKPEADALRQKFAASRGKQAGH